MPEVVSEHHSYICDHCNQGEMFYTGYHDPVHIAVRRNQHQCGICGHVQMLSGIYPVKSSGSQKH